MKDYVENRKPYWLFVDAERGTELSYSLFNYFPEAHYRNAVDQAFEDEAEKELESDGGTTHLHQDRRRSTVYYWLNPDTGAALYHTQANTDEANPFFRSVEEAEQYLEKRSGDNTEQYQGMSLYKARVQKVEDAVEVLMNQSGIDDFW